MKGLLVKDFHLLMQRKSFFFLLAVLTVFMSFTMDGTLFAVGWVTMLMGIVSFSTIAYDEYDNCLPFLMSLPATRRDYAAGKYLFSIISGFAGWIFATVVKLIISLMQSEFGASIKELSTALVFLPLLLILLSCCIPVELKWGAEKGRMYLLGIYGVFFALLAAGIRFLPEAPALVEKMAAGLSFPMAVCLIFILAVLIFAVSLSLSVRIMQKKEF